MKDNIPDTDRIAITGIGLVTSLGFSAPSSLAAIRGCVANFSEHETVMVNGDEYGTELSGAKVARLPEHVVSRGICGAYRAVALLAPAIRECTYGLSDNMMRNAKWRLSFRTESGSGNFTEVLKLTLQDLAIPEILSDDDSLALGRCRFFEDFIQACADLRSGTCHMAFVGCVDSLCETTVLEKLCEVDRLKSGTSAEGIIAGEAAGVILLELESHARNRNAAIQAYINSWGWGFETNPWTGSIRSAASGLSSAFREAFAKLPDRGKEIDMTIADLNGEQARAYEWGVTEGRIFPADDKIRELKHPADCVGDCGAAMGVVLLAAGVGFMSEALPPLRIAISTSDEGGARRVLCLEKGDYSAEEVVIGGKSEKPLTAFPSVIEQHSDDLSFLWLQRNRLIKAPHCDLYDLSLHDRRMTAHLDGFRLAGQAGWELYEKLLESNYAEDCFAPAVLALESSKPDRIQAILETVDNDPAKARPIISALVWIPYEQAEPNINTLLNSNSAICRYIGIAASVAHGRDPGIYLDRAIDDDNLSLKACALMSVGKLGGRDKTMLPKLQENFASDDEDIRFSASWSAALAGNDEAVAVLKDFVCTDSPYKDKALKTALRRMAPAAALSWQEQLAKSPQTIRCAVIGAGVIGDPVLVPWIIEKMKIPELARVAGEAFTMITGADIDQEELRSRRPEGFAAGPNDDPDDENVAMDADDNLPWPNSESIRLWWNEHKGTFQGGARYLLGKPIATEHLRHVLKTGCQRQRAAAALELALMQPGKPLFNVRAPGFRQRIEVEHI